VLPDNYGHAGPEFIRYLLKERHRWEPIRQHYHSEIRRYSNLAPGCPEADRLAQSFASIAVTVALVHEALNLPWDASVALTALHQVWPEIIREARDAAGAERALRDVMAWARSNQARFHERGYSMMGSPSGGWSGLWENKPDWGSIAFYEPALQDILRKFGFEPEAILFEWKIKGWLDTRPDRPKSYLKQVSIPSGDRPYLVVIRRQPIDAAEEGSE
jgi:hypothetical protein